MSAYLLLTGCASLATDEQTIPVWPKPPEEPRYKFEATLRSEGLFTGKADGFMAKLSGKESSASRVMFVKPYDIAARHGVIAVTDSVMRGVHLLHIPTRSVYRIGMQGEGKLVKPAGVAIDGQGGLYVADVSAREVVVYDTSGHFKRRIGGPSLLDRPTDVAVNEQGDRVYVVDTGGIDSMKHQVVVFDGEGEYLFTIGGRGHEEGKFNLPVQAAVAADGTLFVLDAGNFRVQVFDADGVFVKSWGKVGRNVGDLARPRGLAVDLDKHVYVTDGAYANFQVFTEDGELLLPVGGPGEDRWGRYSLPAGIAVDETMRVYVVEQRYRKVEVIKKLVKGEN
jgi:DNA-binding beta-propeller fold protein YncE